MSAPLLDRLLDVPDRVDRTNWRLRLALWIGLAAWSLWLVRADHRSGEIGASFLHGPLLVFHEAGHVIFRLFGEWMGVAGGMLGQLVMPLALALGLLLARADAFGASVGTWFLGVSLLDLAPYMYDAKEPRLVLLSGETGEAGGHDFIYLFSSLGWLARSQAIGGFVRFLGVVVVLLALGWAAWLLARQHSNIDGDVLHEG